MRSLNPAALYQPGEEALEGRGENLTPRKSYLMQWKEMGPEGLTEEELQRGHEMARQLDAFYETHLDALGRKLMEEVPNI